MLEDIGSMKSVKEILDDAKMITSFIYNSLKVVNLMKQFIRDRDLLKPGKNGLSLSLFLLKALFIINKI